MHNTQSCRVFQLLADNVALKSMVVPFNQPDAVSQFLFVSALSHFASVAGLKTFGTQKQSTDQHQKEEP